MLWLSPAGTDALSALREVVQKAALDRGAAGAVHAFLEAVDGPAAVGLLGEERLAAAQGAPRGFAADLAAAATWAAGRRELRAIATPVTVVSGRTSAPIRREAAEALVALLPDADLVRVPAGHLAQIEAPEDVAAAIAARV